MNVTRPHRSRFITSRIFVAVSSVSTTTWNRLESVRHPTQTEKDQPSASNYVDCHLELVIAFKQFKQRTVNFITQIQSCRDPSQRFESSTRSLDFNKDQKEARLTRSIELMSILSAFFASSLYVSTEFVNLDSSLQSVFFSSSKVTRRCFNCRSSSINCWNSSFFCSTRARLVTSCCETLLNWPFIFSISEVVSARRCFCSFKRFFESLISFFKNVSRSDWFLNRALRPCFEYKLSLSVWNSATLSKRLIATRQRK